LLEEPLAPLDHRVQGDPQIIGDIDIVHPLGRAQNDLGSFNHAGLSGALPGQGLQPNSILIAQLDHKWAAARQQIPSARHPQLAPLHHKVTRV
jgi:hypothetical protein